MVCLGRVSSWRARHDKKTSTPMRNARATRQRHVGHPPMLGGHGQGHPSIGGRPTRRWFVSLLCRATNVSTATFGERPTCRKGNVPLYLQFSSGVPSISVEVFLSGGVRHVECMLRLACRLGSRPSPVQAQSVAPFWSLRNPHGLGFPQTPSFCV